MKQKIYIPFLVACALFFSMPLLAQLQPEAMRQIQSLVAEKESRTPVQRKIEAQLLQGLREFRGQKMAAGVNLEKARINADNKGSLKVDITATVSSSLLARIKAAGGTILYASVPYSNIRAQIELSKVETIAAWPEVKFIQPAVIAQTVGAGAPKKVPSSNVRPSLVTNPMNRNGGFPLPRPSLAERTRRVKEALKKYLQEKQEYDPLVLNAGSVNSQGDHAHRADDARNTYGYFGQGIKIGVLSDSYNALGTAATNVTSGDLPGPGNPYGNMTPVTVVADYPSGADEGRAMLQIVHDLAPKAQLFFASAFISEASFADNIVALRNTYNCDVIIDDIFYYDEPVFQDGIVAQAVNTVTAAGGLYFSSAGNEGSVAKNTAGVWEGDFNDAGSPVFAGSTKAGTIHNFGTVAAPVNGDIILATGNVYNLNWADPAGASANDYDLFLVSAAGVVKASSTNIQSGTQNPYEQIGALTLVSGDRLVVFKATSAQVRAFSVNSVRGRLTVATTGQTHGHSAAVDAFSVAATPAATPFSAVTPPGPFPGVFTATNQVETFSSDGLRRIFFTANGTPVTPGNFQFGTNGGTVRSKPDITAADGTTTTVPGFQPFYGTSAAAPHAGAIAALLKSAKPSLTPAQIRSILIGTALDIEASGYDNVSGYGIIQAYQAMQAVNPTPLATINLGTVTVTEGSFRNNNGSLDPGETGNIVVQLANLSLANATGVGATLTTSTPGVTIIRGSTTYGNIAASSGSSNTLVPFIIGVSSSVSCGTTINLSITVAFGGGISPVVLPFTITVGTQTSNTVSSTLGSTPPTGAGFTAITGTQTGRINRFSPASTCGVQKAATLFETTGSRAFDAYTFTNTSPAPSCVTVTMTSAGGINLYTAAYNDTGYVPANPTTHFLGDQGSSAATQTFAVTVAAGKQFTIVISSVTAGAAVGTAYSLNVSYTVCSSGPSCTPVSITTASIASGSTGSPYTQSFAASGGSGNYTFTFSGDLPAGLSFSGSTLRGTPTQAGSFPITITANDVAGCPAGTRSYTLVIAGNAPASLVASYGTPQSAYPGTAFALPLQAIVKDASGNDLPGVKVIFTAPATGASGTFTGGRLSDTMITNNNGRVTASSFTANAITGSYVVTARVNGLTPANFNLTNICPVNYIVTSSADSGPGTLREAVGLSCPGTTVTFDQGVSFIALTSGELSLPRAITITGPGADKLTISGNNSSRIFNITAGTAAVAISGMTLQDGKLAASSTLGGGAILINNGASVGAVAITRCVITNNDLTLPANSLGGAIDNEGGTVTIDRCALLNNVTTYRGGAVQNQGFGSMTITNSTIAGNTAGTAGIGGAIRSFLPLTLTNCTIFGNSAQTGGNISRGGDTITFKNTIIAGGTLTVTGGTGPDISGTGFKSADYNLIGNTATGTITGITTHNLTGVSPRLLPLANYGGMIPGLLPMSNSPVINAGDPTLTSGTDQRDLPRLIGAGADIGAIETNYAVVATAGTPQTALINNPFITPLQARVTESGNGIAGDTIVFTAPATGASGTFPGASPTAIVVTSTTGLAAARAFTANSTPGTYNVTASIGSAIAPVNFTLTNTIVLPVTFSSVTARAVNCTVEVQWKTTTEVNSKNFTIEYSTDNLTYKSLTVIPAQGSSTAEHSYKYTHTAPAKGTVYYRIRQTDKDDHSIVTKVLAVSNACDNGFIVAYPNPVKDKLTVQLSGTATQTLRVQDAAGRLMTQLQVGGGSYEIAVHNWAKGMYMLTILQEGKTTHTLKIVKE